MLPRKKKEEKSAESAVVAAVANLHQKEKSKKAKKSSFQGAFVRLSLREQIFFIKRLAFLIKAGIPILESLHMIREQTRGRSYAFVLDTVITDVSEGQYLAKSMGKFRHMFGDFCINIISFGEASGVLSENLEYLADELKKKQVLRKKVIGAFIYPAVVTLATLAITVFLMVYLFPKIIPIFQSVNMKLPVTTRFLIFLSEMIRSYWHVGLISIIVLTIAFFVALAKSKKFHFYYDKLLLKIPVAGKIVQYYNLANVNRTMGLLLRSGMTISDSLPIAGKTTNNLVYKKEFDHLSKVIDRGDKMSSYLKIKRHLFPEVMSQITSVGERSGNLANSLIYLSELYEAEVDDFTKNLSNLIEPILMIFMGILVGFIAISIITPIYGITQSLSR